MSKTALQELIMSDEQLDAISKKKEEETSYDWSKEIVLKIRDITTDYKENSPGDIILWTVRRAFLMGHREALELMRELIMNLNLELEAIRHEGI